MTGGTASLLRRRQAPARRALIGGADAGALAVLSLGLVLAPFPRALRRWAAQACVRLLPPGRRSREAAQRMQRIGGLSADAARAALETLRAGRLLAQLDLPRALIGGPDWRLRTEGLDAVRAARAEGQGVVLWVADCLGAGDVSKPACAAAGLRLVHMSRPEHGFTATRFGMALLNPLRLRFERRFLAERVVFCRDDPRPAMGRLLAALRDGGVVSIMAGTHEGGRLAEIPFLAGRLRLALGAPRLARIAGARLMPLFVLPDPEAPGGFLLRLGPALPQPAAGGEQGLLETAAAFARQLEPILREQPGVWVGWRRSGQLTAGRA